MLPATHRLRRSTDFSRAVRRGRRAARRTVVLHLAEHEADDPASARVGFVVSRQVGPAVARNRVKRRLRHLMSDRLQVLPEGAVLVVRANPPAATARAAELGADLDGALSRLLGRRPPRGEGQGRR